MDGTRSLYRIISGEKEILDRVRNKEPGGIEVSEVKFKLDVSNCCLVYWTVKQKACVKGQPTRISLKDVSQVRSGCVKNTFDKLSALTTNSTRSMESAFSIIFKEGTNLGALELLADDSETRDAWVKAIGDLILATECSSAGTQEEQIYDLYIKEKFSRVNVQESESLNLDELERLCTMLNVNPSKSLLKDISVKSTNIDNEHIIKMLKRHKSPNFKKVFHKYATWRVKQNEYRMSATDLIKFSNSQQKEPMSQKKSKEIVNRFEPSNNKDSLSLEGFTRFIMFSDRLELMDATVMDDMTHPLSHYWIASSHNTYLTGNQLNSCSSAEAIGSALKQGCRCVEIDCWDGPEGVPIVYHAYTLTSKITFQEAIEAVGKYAFEASDYPLILVLDSHCSAEQQDRMAQILQDNLGAHIYRQSPGQEIKELPSPDSLKRKILLRAKNLLSTNLSNLVFFHIVKLKTSQPLNGRGKCFEMCSLSESDTFNYLNDQTKGPELVQFNCHQLTRVYPNGSRTGSSNLDVVCAWSAGCQMVALNYQTEDVQNHLNRARFCVNGGCGYVLKPGFLRVPSLTLTPSVNSDLSLIPGLKLRLKIISGHLIPKPGGANSGEVVNPFVTVTIRGHNIDTSNKNNARETHTVRDNGFNPAWNFKCEMEVKVPELAILDLQVKDRSRSWFNQHLGSVAIPVTLLREGYRRAYLMDYAGKKLNPAALFIKVKANQQFSKL